MKTWFLKQYRDNFILKIDTFALKKNNIEMEK